MENANDYQLFNELVEIFYEIDLSPPWEYKNTITSEEAENIEKEIVEMIRKFEK